MLRYGSAMTTDERNEILGLTTNEARRFRGDMIQMYKFSKDGSLETFKQKPDRGIRLHSKELKSNIIGQTSERTVFTQEAQESGMVYQKTSSAHKHVCNQVLGLGYYGAPSFRKRLIFR